MIILSSSKLKNFVLPETPLREWTGRETHILNDIFDKGLVLTT
jgi:hypothetical protein